ncbi:MAG: LytTR family transcriptional regulator [Planctomycetaceae bacterium]|nr:LytTR family transcriptional regulator [Planctomycetaceae bacterium]
MKKQDNENSSRQSVRENKVPTEIQLKQGDKYVLMETYQPIFVLIESLKTNNDCKELVNTQRKLATYYQTYNRKTIPADKIIYIKSARSYCTFFLCDGSSILQTKSMKYFLEKYYVETFVRIHNTYAVNTDFIKHIKSKYILLHDDTRLPRGRIFKRKAKAKRISLLRGVKNL